MIVIKVSRIFGVAALFAAALLFIQAVWPETSGQGAQPRFSDKVNLALRRTAHHLLAEAGDTNSRIPAVQHPAADVWQIRLERAFDYDRLPSLLQESFQVHGIQGGYEVSVLDCSTNSLLLGYHFQDFQKGEVPCGGRDLSEGCYDLRVTFNTGPVSGNAVAWWSFASFLLISVLGFTASRWSPFKSNMPPVAPKEANSAAGLMFGHSSLHVSEQKLMVNNTPHQLTYRETKLLHLFVSHPNQVLERDIILQNVWGDEGIIVGRSLDVFVSRLRKLLRHDPSVKLVAVHGVGYRLEV